MMPTSVALPINLGQRPTTCDLDIIRVRTNRDHHPKVQGKSWFVCFIDFILITEAISGGMIPLLTLCGGAVAAASLSLIDTIRDNPHKHTFNAPLSLNYAVEFIRIPVSAKHWDYGYFRKGNATDNEHNTKILSVPPCEAESVFRDRLRLFLRAQIHSQPIGFIHSQSGSFTANRGPKTATQSS